MTAGAPSEVSTSAFKGIPEDVFAEAFREWMEFFESV